MTSQDDIILNLPIRHDQVQSVGARAIDARREHEVNARMGIVRRMFRARMRGATVRQLGGAIGRGVLGAGERTLARSALANPVGILVAGIATAIVVAGRLMSGRSFENMGANVRQMLLGDLDENALASGEARAEIQSDEDLMRIVGKQGRVNAQIRKVFNGLAEFRKRDFVARQLLEQDPYFQVNNNADMLILHVRDKLRQSWMGHGGTNAVAELQEKWSRFPRSGAGGR